jgi:polygalacturonase
VSFSNIVSSGAVAQYPSIIAGVSDALIEDIRLDSIYMGQVGGGTSAWAALDPPDKDAGYPEADMFGTLPATGFYLRHARNLQLSNIEIATEAPDARVAIWASEVEDLDVFRLRAPKGARSFSLRNVNGFRSFGSLGTPDRTEASIQQLQY